jgi:hypothetical protein
MKMATTLRNNIIFFLKSGHMDSRFPLHHPDTSDVWEYSAWAVILIQCHVECTNGCGVQCNTRPLCG